MNSTNLSTLLKKAKTVLVVATCLLCFSGWTFIGKTDLGTIRRSDIQLEVSVIVHKDETADLELNVLSDKGVSDPLINRLENQGWEIDTVCMYPYVTATKEDVELEQVENELKRTEAGFKKFSLKKSTGERYVLSWEVSERCDMFTLRLPNEPGMNNAVHELNNSLQWYGFEYYNVSTIKARFEVRGGSNMLLRFGIIGGSVVVAGIVILVIVLIVKKKKNRGPKIPAPIVTGLPTPQQFAPFSPQQSVPVSPQKYAPQAPAVPRQYVPQAPAVTRLYVPQSPQQYASNSNLPNPGLPQIGMPPAQGTDPNNNQNQ